MELDGGHRQAAVLHRLCHSALAPGGAAEVIAQTVRRLVVGAVDQDAAAPQPVEQAARGGTNGMPQVALPLMEGAQRIPQILDQGAAQATFSTWRPRQIPRMGRPADR